MDLTLAAFPELVSVIPCNLHIKNSGNPMGFWRFSLETIDSPGWLWSAEAWAVLLWSKTGGNWIDLRGRRGRVDTGCTISRSHQLRIAAVIPSHWKLNLGSQGVFIRSIRSIFLVLLLIPVELLLWTIFVTVRCHDLPLFRREMIQIVEMWWE